MQKIITKIKSLDPDDILAYNTIKMVKIRDRRLGAFHYLLQLGIFLYIIIGTILVAKRYLKTEPPTGAFRATVKQPDAWPEATTLPYCLQSGTEYPAGYKNYNCTYMLGLDLTYPPAPINSILVATRLKDAFFAVSNNSDCSAQLPLSAACAPATNSRSTTDLRYYTAGIENYTLFIEHAIFGRQNEIVATNKDSNGVLHYDNSDFKDPNNAQIQASLKNISREGDIFKMSTILTAADLRSLDDDSGLMNNKTFRYDGVLLIMVIEYSNAGYSTSTLEYDYYIYQIPGVTVVAQQPSEFVSGGYTQRTWYGIRIIFALAGTVGKFDFPTLLTALVNGLVLLKVATTIVDLFMSNFMPDKALYHSRKYEVTEDFSEVRSKKLNDQL